MSSLASSLSTGFQKISNVGKTALKAVGTAVTAASAAIGVFAKSTIDAGMNFDAAMSKVAAVSGATGDDFDALRDKAIEMGSNTKFSATEAAEAFNYMAMAGWKTEDMLGGIEGIMNLAAASGENLATTSDIVTDALTAFGMTADESGHFADILAVASSNANTDVGMMGETFKYVAPVCGTLGYSAEDAALAIGLMANSSVKGSMAGTALRSIIARLSTDAGASANKLGALGTLTEELGVEFYNTDGSARALGDVLLETREAWKDLTEEQKINYANTIAGQEGLAAWNAMMNASDADLEKLTSSLEDCDGAALQMAETMQDNLAGDITKFKSALEGAQIVISDELTPTLRGFVQYGTNAISELSKAFQEGGFEGLLDKASEMLSVLVTKFTEYLPKIAEIGTSMMTSFISEIGNHTGELKTAATEALHALISGFDTIVDQVLPIISDFMPVVAETILSYKEILFETGLNLITAFVSGISENIGDIAQAALSTVERLANSIVENIPILIDSAVNIINNLGEFIVDNLPLLITAAMSIITTLADGLSQNLPTIIPTIVDIIVQIVETLCSPDTLLPLIDAALEIIVALAQGLVDAIPSLISAIPTILAALVDTIILALPDIITAGIQIIFALIDGLIQSIPQLVAAVPSLIIGIVNGIIQNLDKIIVAAPQIILALAQGLIGAIPSLVAAIPQLILAIVHAFTSYDWGSLGKNLVTGIKDGISNAWESFKGWVKSKFDGLVSSVKSLLGIHSPSTVMQGVGENLVAGLENGISDMPERTQKTLTATSKNISDFGLAAAKTSAQASAAMLSGVMDNISKLPSQMGAKLDTVKSNVSSFGSSLVSSFSSMGKNVISGMISGIGSMVSSLYSSIKNALSGLVSKAKSALGIHSPSKVFAGIGEYMVEGLGQGWSGAIGDVEKMIDRDMTFSGHISTSSTNKATGGAGLAGANINIYVNGANIQDDQKLAEKIAFQFQMLIDREAMAVGA